MMGNASSKRSTKKSSKKMKTVTVKGSNQNRDVYLG